MNSNLKKIFKVWAVLCIAGALLILIIPLVVRVSINNRLYYQLYDSSKEAGIESRDFAIILGAGITRSKRPGRYLRHRLDDAVDLYHHNKVKKILLSGDNGRRSHDEISTMNNYLLENGIPQDVIFGDYAGFDTYSSMERARKVFGIESAIVVTQGYHLYRSVFIARYKGIDAIGFATSPKLGNRKYFIREWLATIKSTVDCLRNRKSKYYGRKVDTDGKSNIELDQL